MTMSPPVIVQERQPHSSLERSVSSSSVHDDNIPEEFVCPIGLCVMNDPVVSKDGQNYDRQAILQWLSQGNTTCPLTRQPLKPSLLVPNVGLRMNIMEWKTGQGIKPDDPLDFEEKSLLRLASLGLTVDLPMSDESRQEQRRRRRRHGRQQEQVHPVTENQPVDDADDDDDVDGALSDILALYEEVINIVTPTTAATPNNNTIGDDDDVAAAAAAAAEDELEYMKALYHEVVDICQ
jgi:hypothetical protein